MRPVVLVLGALAVLGAVLLLVLALAGPEKRLEYDLTAGYPVPGTDVQIVIGLEHSHPFLAEYRRTLAVAVGDRIVSTDYLYPDSGGGSQANLYRLADGTYLLIDMNGYWFRVDPKRRTIQETGWHWEEHPTGEYLGCFLHEHFDVDRPSFLFRSAEDGPEPDPYKFKDPDRYPDS